MYEDEDFGEQRDYKSERDTLIDDLSWYKAKVSRLERENRFLLSRKENLFDSWRDENKRSVALSKRLEQLEQENEKQHDLLSEFSQHIGNKPSSSTYKYFRAKLDGMGIKVGE